MPIPLVPGAGPARKPDRRRTLEGIALYRTGKLAEAEESLLRTHELDPNEPRARLMLVNVYVRAGNPAGVLEQVEAYLKENPKGEQRAIVKRIRTRILHHLKDSAGS